MGSRKDIGFAAVAKLAGVSPGTVSNALNRPEKVAVAGKALADGEITGEEGDTFEAGELGEREVGENGVVIVGPSTVFNADNIDDYDF